MRKICRVLVQRERGEFSGRNTFIAYLGFEQKGYEIVFIEIDAIRGRTVTMTDETMAVGGIGFVRESLALLGIELPAPIDYPPCLAPILGRRLWKTTWREIRAQHAQPGGKPVFVKPTSGLKSFTGTVISQFRDLIPTASFSNEMELTASEPVTFQSEWRYFVHHHDIIGVGHYSGDPL